MPRRAARATPVTAMPPCTACARADAGSLCSGCRFAAYCGAACQRAHWAAHKPICKAIAADVAQDADALSGGCAMNCHGCAVALTPEQARLQVCTRCYSATYCGLACQRAHWPTHKGVCKAVGKA